MNGTATATLEERLADCTVRLEVGGKHEGTGFFVAPGQVLTCYHVIERSQSPAGAAVKILYNQESYTAELVAHWKQEHRDLALLRVPGFERHPCVLLGGIRRPGKDNYCFGYPEPDDDGNPVTLEFEGATKADEPVFKLKAGQVVPGMSGAPVLSKETGTVASIMSESRDPRSDRGGYAIPMATLFKLAPELERENLKCHESDKTWARLLTPSQRDQTRLPSLVGRAGTSESTLRTMLVTVGPSGGAWNVSATVIDGDRRDPAQPVSVDLNPVRVEVARLFRDWALRGRVAASDKVRLLGGILYKAVFSNSIDETFLKCLSQRGKRLLVALRFEKGADEELVHLPWEYLFHPVRQPDLFFASDSNIAFCRCVRDAYEPRGPSDALRVLVVRVPPPPSGDPAGREDVREICDPLRRLGDDLTNLEFDEIETPDPDALEEKLTTKNYDVVHYVGLGRLEGDRDEIMLGRGEPNEIGFFDGSVLGQALGVAQPPRLVILQPCEGPKTVVPADFGKLGPTLFGLQIEAVLAFQDPIGWDLAMRFNRDLYTELSRGGPLQTAVQDSRRKLRTKAPRAFVSPALFTMGPSELRLVVGTQAQTAGGGKWGGRVG